MAIHSRAVQCLCHYFNTQSYFGWPLAPWLIHDNLIPLSAMYVVSWLISLSIPSQASLLSAIVTLLFVFSIILAAGLLVTPKIRKLVINF